MACNGYLLYFEAADVVICIQLEKKIAIMRNKYSALQSHSTKLELENKRLRREIDAQTRRDNTSTRCRGTLTEWPHFSLSNL